MTGSAARCPGSRWPSRCCRKNSRWCWRSSWRSGPSASPGTRCWCAAPPSSRRSGAATFLCVDKTGTLTENRMVLTTTWRDGKVQDLKDMDGLRGDPQSRCGRRCSRRPSARSIPWTGLSANWAGDFRLSRQEGRSAPHLSAPSRVAGVHPGLAGSGWCSVCRKRGAGGDFPSLPAWAMTNGQRWTRWLPGWQAGACGCWAWHPCTMTRTGRGSRRS